MHFQVLTLASLLTLLAAVKAQEVPPVSAASAPSSVESALPSLTEVPSASLPTGSDVAPLSSGGLLPPSMVNGTGIPGMPVPGLGPEGNSSLPASFPPMNGTIENNSTAPELNATGTDTGTGAEVNGTTGANGTESGNGAMGLMIPPMAWSGAGLGALGVALGGGLGMLF